MLLLTFSCIKDLLEFNGKRNGVKKDIDLEDADEEETEVFEHLCEEIPEESDVWSKIWNRQTVENTHTLSSKNSVMIRYDH